jgi:hypothetical protein
MEEVGSTAALAIVLQADTDTEPLGTDGSFRAQVLQGDGPNRMTDRPPNEIDIDEPNSGKPETLAEFLAWAAEQFPADNYALDVFGHGAGWAGVAQDLSAVDGGGDPGDWLSMQELRTALSGVRHKPRLIAFSACRMADIEVAQQIRRSAEILVASQDCLPGEGFPYDLMIAQLAAHPEWDATALATSMVDEFGDHYGENSKLLSAIELEELEPVALHSDTLAAALGTALSSRNGTAVTAVKVQRAVARARADAYVPALVCAQAGRPCDASPDYADLLSELDAEPDLEAAQKLGLAALRKALEAAVIARWPVNGRAHGLSVYFPRQQAHTLPGAIDALDDGSTTGKLYAPNPFWDARDSLPVAVGYPLDPEPDLRFAAESRWDELLFRFYQPVADAGADITAAVGETVTLDGRGSSDSDGALTMSWDFAPHNDTDREDRDRDGAGEADDDDDARGEQPTFTCATAGTFPVHLVVRDDYETAPGVPQHFNASEDDVVVTCKAADVKGGGGGRDGDPVRGADLRRPRLRVSGLGRRRMGPVLRRGVRLRATCSEPCTLVTRLVLSRRTARRLALPRRFAVERTRLPGATARRVTIKLSAKARRRLPRMQAVRVAVQLTATDAAGNARRVTRTLRLVR